MIRSRRASLLGRARAEGQGQMTRDFFFADLEQTVKRKLSEKEIAATGGLVIGNRLPEDRRKRKRCLR
jgi:hypothetical protein